MLIILLVVLVFFIQSTFAQPQACLLRCKDGYMLEMQSLLADDAPEWSVNLVTPLQSLFHNSNQATIYRRLQSSCSAHSNFIGCLQRCPESRARSIIELGQTNWAFICSSLRHNREFHTTILSCWANHGKFISAQCHFHALLLQTSVVDLIKNGLANSDAHLEELCRTLSIYDKCYISHSDKVCGKQGWEFLLKLNTKNSYALIRLLTESADQKTLPSMCDQWQYPEEYSEWHVKKIAQAHESLSSHIQLPLIELIIIIVFMTIN